jgi:glycosyltransferase involved in cell wall biosynthesis
MDQGPSGRAMHDSAGARICIVAAVPLSLNAFMAPHVRALSRTRDVTLVASRSTESLEAICGEHVAFQPVAIARNIALVGDLKALIALWSLCRRHRFNLVQSITPKAGLLTMLAGKLAGVPVRVHWFTGQVWVTKRGVTRQILKAADRILAKCATHLLVDSPSQCAFLVEQRVVRQDRVCVLENGSVAGVDVDRFRPNSDARSAVRRALSIPDHAVVALYLGRLTRDKGVLELASAYLKAAQTCPDLHLLIVGPDEAAMRAHMQAIMKEVASRTHFVDHTDRPEAYMTAADVFVLPSHREGFGVTVIEAAACETPTIGTRIYGLIDAIVDGETGALVPVGDVAALSGAIVRLASDHEWRRTLGRNARRRVESYFTQQQLVSALMEFYDDVAALQSPHEPVVVVGKRRRMCE